ncbi:AMP-binding protein [Brevibacterium album]|uniref:AMP-binding protein n=1 Tax=Brevibacterium album TaxID=417948 RepID=UPI0004062A48|nr:AMP-binding protein [Brevibacterium album]
MRIFDRFLRAAAADPDRPAVMATDTDAEGLSFAELAEIGRSAAAGLAARGLGPGQTVSVCAPNRGRAVEAVLAVWGAGGVWNPLSTRSPLDVSLDLMRRAETALVLVSREHHDAVGRMREAMPGAQIVSLDERGPCDVSWDELRIGGAEAPELPGDPFGSADAAVVRIGTGGTTGRSKIVEWTTRVWESLQASAEIHLPQSEGARMLIAAPFTHAAGVMGLVSLFRGGTLHLMDGFDAGAVLDVIARGEATHLFLPPTAFYDLVEEQRRRPRDVSGLEELLLAAAPIAPQRLADGARLLGWKVAQSFGQAEAPMLVSYLSAAQVREAAEDGDPAALSSCGRPTALSEVSIRDAHGAVATGASGEICVRGSLVADGYFRDPARTAEAHADGWLRTGDVGFLDPDGFLHIRDRLKDMIITGGFNVYAAEVEAVLLTQPGVGGAAVVGLSDERWGERVTAFVVPADARRRPSAEELIAAVRERLGPVHAPKEIRFLTSLPATPVGKIDKVRLREDARPGAEGRIR